MSRRAVEDMKRREIEHGRAIGKPITEREAERRARETAHRAEVDRLGVTTRYRGGERP